MDRLYWQFVQPGDLVFDVGAHVGDRVGAFRRLGARVVAVEPQPALVRTLAAALRPRPAVTIEPVAVGRSAGTLELKLNIDNPTVSTASPAFVEAAHGAPGWEGQAWTKSVRVPLTTLDALIARHGLPAFIKIDVEGFEAEALAGLTQPPRALSFEFTTIQREVAAACLERCAHLVMRATTRCWARASPRPCRVAGCAPAIGDWLRALPEEANSGDVYAAMA